LFRKETKGKKFLIVDAAMNDLIRPSLYSAYHTVLPLKNQDAAMETVDVVGAICESGDFLAKDRELPYMQRGDYLAVMTAGAYGYTLSSNYNERPRAVEVLVDGDQHKIIREREKAAY
jgi:diaminopimelate decarboxylase